MEGEEEKEERYRRVHTVVKLLFSAKTASYVCIYASEEWGLAGQQLSVT